MRFLDCGASVVCAFCEWRHISTDYSPHSMTFSCTYALAESEN